MDEIYSFLRLLKKFKFILIIVPILSVVITFFLITNLPDSYISRGQISTGIVGEPQKNLLSSGTLNNFEVDQEFSNMMEMIRLKKMLDQVSYQLALHDLTSKHPFRKGFVSSSNLSEVGIGETLSILKDKYSKIEALNLSDKRQNNIYKSLKAIKYDNEAIKAKLNIYRASESDFINIEFESENPELSAFVVNNLVNEFVKYYTFLVKGNDRSAGAFLENLLARKKDTLDAKSAALRRYRIDNRVLNLDEQSKLLYQQTLNYSDKKQQTIEGIASKTGALNEIERKFNSRERGYIESTLTKVNVDIMSTTEELKALNDLYIHNDFDPKIKVSIDSLNHLLSAQINKSTDSYIYNPLVSKQDLVQKKMDLTVQLDLDRYSLASIEKEQGKINNQFDKLVPNEADIQTLDRDVEIATKEYLDILDKYNQSSLQSVFSNRLHYVQEATLGLPQPSKKMLLVILSGIISFVFCLLVLFVIFLKDRSIRTPKNLANKTQSAVLGFLNLMSRSFNMEEIWYDEQPNGPFMDFKNQLRALRFEIDQELNGNQKVLVVTSLQDLEGKSFLALNLAFAWKATNQKVLIIDGNFKSPKISQSLKQNVYLEDYLNDKVSIDNDLTVQSISVLSNKGNDISLLEIATESKIKEKIEALKSFYDIIIIETGSLDKFSLSKEWISFGDMIVAVFKSGQTINDAQAPDVQYLRALDDRFKGWVLNKVDSANI